MNGPGHRLPPSEINGRGAHPGVAEGVALVSDSTITGWDTFDLATGSVNEDGHPLHGQSVRGRVLIIRGARGSTGWGTQFLRLRVAGAAPIAMVFPHIDSRVGTACVVTGVPVVTDLDHDIFAAVCTGDLVRVDGDIGRVTILGRAAPPRITRENEPRPSSRPSPLPHERESPWMPAPSTATPGWSTPTTT